MVVPGAVVSPGHTKRLSLLPCRAPHNSPCTLMRTWLRQMGLTLRLVAGLLRRTGSRPCSRPAGSLSVLVFGGVRCGGVPGGGIGAVVDALWGECGIGAVVDAVE